MEKVNKAFENNQLSKAIAEKYEPVIVPTVVEQPVKDNSGKIVKRLKVDLRKGTLKQADELYEAGFRGIRLKKSEASVAPSKK